VVNLDCVTPQVGAHDEIREGIVVKGSGDTDINGNTDFDIDFDYLNYATKYDVYVGSTQLNRRLGFTTETPFGLTVAPPPEVWVDASIDADNSCNFDTLHEAVDTVASSGTVHVESGSYKGWVTVSRGMEIIGEGDSKPTFTITSSGDAVKVDTDEDVTIENLRFVSTAPLSYGSFGLHIYGGSNVIIQSNIFENFVYTIRAEQGNIVQVLDNVIRAEFDNCASEHCMHGIELMGVDPLSVVKGNQLTFNDKSWGINIGPLMTITEISDNTITNTNPDLVYIDLGESAGIYLQEQSDSACPPTLPSGTLVVKGNVIDGFWWGVSGVGAKAIVKENQILRGYLGVGVASEGHISCMDIEDNVIQDALYNGVEVFAGSYALIRNNLIDNVKGPGSPRGLGLNLAGNADVEYNHISRAQVAGVKVYYGSEATIVGNVITDCNEGIASEGAVEIVNNQIIRASSIGIHDFAHESDPTSALIEGNFIADSGMAIDSTESDVTIHGNTLIGNEQGIKLTNTASSPTFQRTVTHNWIVDTVGSGIIIEDASPQFGREDQISWNLIEMTQTPIGTSRGILIKSSVGTLVHHNTLIGNYYGIYSDTSSGIEVKVNDIIGSESYGAYLVITTGSQFFYNNFIDNFAGPTSQAFDDDLVSSNTWFKDPISGGNYWSDIVNCHDLDEDGICDLGLTYSIDGGNNEDEFPLFARYIG
jgi:parallel beta-helix repeat protein